MSTVEQLRALANGIEEGFVEIEEVEEADMSVGEDSITVDFEWLE